MRSIVFTGGGTGGHIFPGLAVIEQLDRREHQIRWIGSSSGIDRSLVESADISFYGIPSGKLRRYASLKNFFDLFKIVAGFFCSLVLLIRFRPDVLFSKGGFVSVPPCFASRLLGIPVITHECDFSPGLATRLNARIASKILVSYPETARFFSETTRARITVTGNPVRSAFYSGDPDAGRAFLSFTDNSLPIIFFQGGSLGAVQINDLVFESLPLLLPTCNIVHQTGQSTVSGAPPCTDPLVAQRYRPFPFIRGEMADVLAASYIVVSRSGANTIWECAAAGKPMILVPLEKGSSRGDQVENASYFQERGAACVLSGDQATAAQLVTLIHSLADNSPAYQVIQKASSALGSHRPSQIIADIIRGYVQ
ncbi:MAG: undecaprenyldiphospho-muramoylpentapeptide beta-N-acetylglucosaminyltransferase [Spirochaetales bacterium]|nr:undecaprenyldiphospho-muramoylpentapeptide beta-N-acetylglucosaminyltransferase [Spirochaetales bacterium]